MRVVRRKDRYLTSISLINLIDIIFVLLIFFMITTTFKKHTSFDINLPKSSISLQKNSKSTPEIFCLADGTYILKIDKKETVLSYEDLKKEVLAIKDKKRIKLSGDKTLNYGDMVKVMVELKKSDIQNVELNIEKE